MSVPVATQEKVNDEEKGPVLVPQTIFNRSVDMIKKRPLPVVISSGVTPGAPVPGRTATVRVGVTNARSGVSAKVERVDAYYTAGGGGSWHLVAMMKDAKDAATWLGALPGLPRGAAAVVSYDIANSAGGSLIELGCLQKKWPPESAHLKSGCAGFDTARYEKCVGERRPRGCLFAGGAEDAPVDDLPSRAGDDLDIVGFRVGFDDRFLYFDMEVQREITGGSLTPIALNQYSVIIFDPKSKDPEPKEGLPLGGVMARFLPMGVKAPSFVEPCAAVLNRDGKPAMDASAVECRAEGPHLLMKVRRDLWGKEFPKEHIVFAHTGILRERNFDEFSFVDITGLTRVRLGARTYRTEK